MNIVYEYPDVTELCASSGWIGWLWELRPNKAIRENVRDTESRDSERDGGRDQSP